MALAVAACGGSGVTLTIDGDRAVPAELDAICVGIADRALDGGSFGRTYRLTDRLAGLPQTLAVEAGEAETALAWARGYRGGVVVAQDVGVLDFGGDVGLRLDRCPRARSGTIMEVAAVEAPGGVVVASTGQGGTVAVVVDGAGATIVDDSGDALTAAALDGAGGTAAIAFDADGDCDDDLAIAGAGGLRTWIRDGLAFTAAADLPPAAAVVAFDADADGDQDLVAGTGASLVLYQNRGGGELEAPAAIDHGGAVSDVRALAAGDLDGDGHADLIVGQGSGPPFALTGSSAGAAGLVPAPAVFPPVALDVRAFAPADADGDLDLDLLVVVDGAAPRVYINRAGRLEDQSFIRLPQPAPAALAAAAGDWDGDCAPDVVLASTAASSALRGGTDGAFTTDTALAGAAAAVLADLDDDGDPDLVLAGNGNARWYRR